MLPCAGLLGHHNSITTNEIIEGGVLAAMLTLISSYKLKGQLAGLRVVASLALISDSAARKLLTPRLQTVLEVSSWTQGASLHMHGKTSPAISGLTAKPTANLLSSRPHHVNTELHITHSMAEDCGQVVHARLNTLTAIQLHNLSQLAG